MVLHLQAAVEKWTVFMVRLGSFGVVVVGAWNLNRVLCTV